MPKMQPLHQAIVNYDHSRTKELLEAGADTQLLTANGRNALQLAEFAHNLPAMVMLEGSRTLSRASDDIWCTALKRNDFDFDDIPRHRLNDVLCDTLLLCNPDNFAQLPDAYRQPENLSQRCLRLPQLIAALPTDIQQLPAFYRPLLTEVALSRWSRPWSEQFIDDALADYPDNYCDLSETDKTYRRSFNFVKANGNRLSLVPDSLKDHALCLAAMESGYALEAVPKIVLDDTIIQRAGNTLNEVIQRSRDYDNFLNFLPSVSVETLTLLPKAMRSYAIYLAAVATDYQALALVPEDLKTLELCCAALEGREWLGMQLHDIFSMIPESLHAQVHAQANFQHHIQPGELEDWDSGDSGEHGDSRLLEDWGFDR